MKKRIAFISEHQSPLAALGGVEGGGQVVYVDKLSKELTTLGYEVDVFTRWDNKRLPETVNGHNGVRVIHIKAGPVNKQPKEKLLPYMKEFTENMLQFIDQEQVEYKLIHAHFFMSALVAAELKKKRGIPFVVTFHALGKVRREFQGENDSFPDERFAIEEQIVREADQIIAECPQDREDLVYHYHANQDNITIIPCGYDPYEFYPIDKRLARMTVGLPQDEKIVLQLGRIVPRKGIDNVIESVARVHNEYKTPTRLLIVGGDADTPNFSDPEMKRLKRLAENHNIASKVTFIGSRGREQLKYYYNAADVFVSTPWYEPFGITPLEAMACGKPVIGSKVGGIQFSVINGKTGFLVPPREPEILAEKLLEILTNDKLASLFSHNALTRVTTFFTWKTIAQTMATMYEKVLYDTYNVQETYQDQLSLIDENVDSLIETLKKTKELLRIPTLHATNLVAQALANGSKILACGNGGSATDAQHFAAELVGHYQVDHRPGLPVLALNTDTAVLTAIANDFNYNEVFARQVEAFGEEGDLIIGISTSGNSQNIIEAFKKAQEKHMFCIGFLGKDGGALLPYCDVALIIPSNDTQRIQEMHTYLIHTICQLVEKQLFGHKPVLQSTSQPILTMQKNDERYDQQERKEKPYDRSQR